MNSDKVLYLVLRRNDEKDNMLETDYTIHNNTTKLIQKKQAKAQPPKIIMQYVFTYSADAPSTTFEMSRLVDQNDTGPLGPLRMKLEALTLNSELVIRGHGGVQSNRLSNITPEVLARVLLARGFSKSCRVNLTGCNMGRNALSPRPDVGNLSAATVGSGSFAAIFQKTLWKEGGLTCTVHARTSSVIVEDDGTKKTVKFGTSGATEEFSHQQAMGKIKFNIDGGGAQVLTYAY